MQIFQVEMLADVGYHALGKVEQLLPRGALNSSVYVRLARQLTKAKNPDYAEDFPRQAVVKRVRVQYVLFKEQGTTSSIPCVAL